MWWNQELGWGPIPRIIVNNKMSPADDLQLTLETAQ